MTQVRLRTGQMVRQETLARVERLLPILEEEDAQVFRLLVVRSWDPDARIPSGVLAELVRLRLAERADVTHEVRLCVRSLTRIKDGAPQRLEHSEA